MRTRGKEDESAAVWLVWSALRWHAAEEDGRKALEKLPLKAHPRAPPALASTRRHPTRRSSSTRQQDAVVTLCAWDSPSSAADVLPVVESSRVSRCDEHESSIGPGALSLFSSATAECTLASSWSNVRKCPGQSKGRKGAIEVTLSDAAACDDPAF